MHHYPTPSWARKFLLTGVLILTFLRRLLGADATLLEVENFPEPPHRTDINPALLYWEALLLNSFRPQSEHDYLTTNEWNGKKLDDQFRAFASSPNGAFRIIEQAAHQKAPCDWGYDLTYGPTLLLPSLAKVKQLVILERHRLRLHLESGDVKVGIEEWLATETMAHQVSRDGTLISCLVQFAMENILINGIAENWFRLDDKSLATLERGLSNSIPWGMVSQCTQSERTAGKDWMIRKLRLIEQSTTDLEKRRQLVAENIIYLFESGDDDGTKKALAQINNDPIQLIELLEGLTPFYNDADLMMQAPFTVFLESKARFEKKVAASTNAMVRPLIGDYPKTRLKEFAAQTRLAMLRAAMARRLRGEQAFQSVLDPMTGQPFSLQPVKIGGAVRGFELRSLVKSPPALDAIAQVFLEKDGPALFLDGPKAGQLKP